MSGKRSLTNIHINTLIDESSIDELEHRLTPKSEPAVKPLLPMVKVNTHRVGKMWNALSYEPHNNLLENIFLSINS